MTDRGVDARRSGLDASGRDELTDDRSLGDLVGELTRDFSQLMRQEVQLAKTELKEEAVRAGRAAAQLTGAAVAAHLCLLLASLAVAWAIGEALSVWAGLAIVAAILGVIAAVLYSRGREQARQIDLVPEETVETLKEDAQWARAQPK
jgi:uncharacterized membrane protein YqjE